MEPEDLLADNTGSEGSPSSDTASADLGANSGPTSPIEAFEQSLAEVSGQDGNAAAVADPNAPKAAEQAAPEGEGNPDEKLPFHNHPRWQEVLGERDTLKAQLEEVAPKIERLDYIDNFCSTNGLAPEEVAQGYTIMAALKACQSGRGDPAKALDMLRPFVGSLLSMTGEILPEDLQSQVQQGFITEAHAKELSRLRQGQQFQQKSEEQRQQEAWQGHVNSVVQQVNSWNTAQKSADPDWSVKEPLVLNAIQVAIQQQGYPRTVEDAKAICAAALEGVEKHLAPLRPKRPAKAPVKGGNNGTQKFDPTQAKSAREVFENSLSSLGK
jgi:hypothetical protein